MITTTPLGSLTDGQIREADTIRAVDPARPGFFRLIHSPAMRARRVTHGLQADIRHQLDVQVDSEGEGVDRLRLRVAAVYPDASVALGRDERDAGRG
ncbi:MAG: hypothetical protein ACRC33_23470 [Gemmataceae bacterium]